MHHIPNTFPLLEEPFDPLTTTINPSSAHARIIWLIRAVGATQTDFVLQLLAQEPEPEAFHSLMAMVESMTEESCKQWLGMEVTVAAKKVQANMAQLKKLCDYYRIAKTAKDRNDQSFRFRFPHQDEWTEVHQESALPLLLAKEAFPWKSVVGRYKKVRMDSRVVEEALHGHGREKRVKKEETSG